MSQDVYADAPRLPLDAPLDPRTLVQAGERGVEIEIGPGRGWFMIERLEAVPGTAMIGLEIRRKWASIVDQRLDKRGLSPRGRVFAEDARQVFSRLVGESVSVVYLHFPDPWWKKRHTKRRVLTPALAGDIARVLQRGGELFVQTDVPERAEAYAAVLASEPQLEPWSPAGPRIEDNPFLARSPRERRAVEDGLPVFRLLYRRAGAGARRP